MTALASKLHLHVPSPFALLTRVARFFTAIGSSYATALVVSRMIERDGTLSEDGRRLLGLED